MADAVTSQTIYQDAKRAVMAFTNLSDGTGEAAVAKVDVSALSPAANWVSILQIWFAISGMPVTIIEDAGTDVTLMVLNGTGHLDFRSFGGWPITKAASYTGDILFTIDNAYADAGDSYTIVMEMEKY